MRVAAKTLDVDERVSRTDARWLLAQRIVASGGFARSRLLCRFLMYVVEEVLADRASLLSEHQIGVAVFARPRGYRTEDDNIVRNYARQLRRRLDVYFAEDGRDEPLRLEIPTGGYVPRFLARNEEAAQTIAATGMPELAINGRIGAARAHENEDRGAAGRDEAGMVVRGGRHRQAGWGIALAAWTLATALVAGLITQRWMNVRAGSALREAQTTAPVSHALWLQIFAPGSETYVVPADAGFNLMEDAAQTSIPVADYMQGGGQAQSSGEMNAQTENDLRTQEFTDFASAQISAEIMRLPEYPAHGAALRFPRDLRLDDLREKNVVLIGSLLSNPWSALVDGPQNFSIVPLAGMRGASVVNRSPLPGEAKRYESHWNEAQHETWGIVAFERNLSGKGWVLLLEGLDVAGTQSAADFVMGSAGMQSVLQKAKQADGALAPFEILLRTTSLQSHAAGAEVVAMRVGPGKL